MIGKLNVFDPDGCGDGETVLIAGVWYRVRVRPLADHAAGRLPDGPTWMKIDGHAVGLERVESTTSSSGAASPRPPRLAGT